MFRVAPNSNQKLWRHQRQCSRRRRRCCCCGTCRHLEVFQLLGSNNQAIFRCLHFQQIETLPSVAIKGAMQMSVIRKSEKAKNSSYIVRVNEMPLVVVVVTKNMATCEQAATIGNSQLLRAT